MGDKIANVIRIHYEEVEACGEFEDGQTLKKLQHLYKGLAFRALKGGIESACVVKTDLAAEALEKELICNTKNNPLVAAIIARRERLGVTDDMVLELGTIQAPIIIDRTDQYSRRHDDIYQRREVTTKTPLSAKALRSLLEILKPREPDPERTVREKPPGGK